MNDSILVAIIWTAILFAYIFVLSCVSRYAKRLGRESIALDFFALFFTPLIAFFCLYMLGETDLQRKTRIIEEERWKRSCDENKANI